MTESQIAAALDRPRTAHGSAEYDPELNVIRLAVYGGGSKYEVDLDRCRTTAEFTNWVLHLNGKKWGAKALPDFLACFEDAIALREEMDAEQYLLQGDKGS